MGFARSCEGGTWGAVGMRQEGVTKAQDEKDPQARNKGLGVRPARGTRSQQSGPGSNTIRGAAWSAL